MADGPWTQFQSSEPTGPWSAYGIADSPGLMSRIGSQVGDFFSSAAHAMNPENAMAMIPTSMEDLKNKAGDEWQNIKSHVAGAGEQFGQGNIGAGVSTLMHGVPVIGPATGQSAEDLRQGNVGKAAGEIAPFFIPGMPDAASATGRGISGATTRGLDWAQEATVPLQNKMASAVNALPPTLVKNAMGAVVSGVSPHPLIGWFSGKAAGNMLVDWAKDHPNTSIKDAPPEVQAAAMEQNPGVSIGQTGTTPGLPQAYVVPGKKSPGIQPLPAWEPSSFPVVGRSASMQGSAIAPTPTAVPVPKFKPGNSPSQSGVGIPWGDVFTGTTGTSEPGGFTGTTGSPSNVPPTPTGPTPQFLDEVARAVGAKDFGSANTNQVRGVETILKDMESQGKAPYPGTYVPTQPIPVSASPQNPLSVAPAPQTNLRPPDGPMIPDTWTDKQGRKWDVNMISPDQLQAHANKFGQTIDQSEAELNAQGITVPDRKTIQNSLFYRAQKVGISDDNLKQILHDKYLVRGVGDASSSTLLNAYGDLLHRQGPFSFVEDKPFSDVHHEDVLFNKVSKPQILSPRTSETVPVVNWPYSTP